MTDSLVKGGPELIAFMGAFPKRMQNGAVRAGLVAGARVVRDQARVLAPRASGKMAKAIRTGSTKVNQDGTVSVRIRLRSEKSGQGYNNHAFLGAIWERGRRAYSGIVIQRAGGKRARSKKFHTDGTDSWGRFPDLAALSAHPFMAPALDMKAVEAVNAFGARVREYLKDKTGFTAPVFEAQSE
jgi:HK97 gp10 family phage protein